MSEFITIQVGQCGNQIGAVFWPSVLAEYGFRNLTDGITTKTSSSNSSNKYFNDELYTSFNSFFSIPQIQGCNIPTTLADLKQSKIKARSILVDMEDSVINRYKTGPLKDLFDDQCIITNYPGSGNNWAEGFCYHGPCYKDKLLNSIRRALEKCDSIQGFLLIYSVGGGTGSGLGAYILQLLDDEFPGVERFVSCVYPTGTEDVITCPYNMALSTTQLTEHATCIFPVENRALMDIVTKQYTNKYYLHSNTQTIVEYRPFHDMNNVIVNMLLNLTSGSRFPGNLNLDINEIYTNMVPYPKMHFLSSGYSPITLHSTKNPNLINQADKNDHFRAAYSKNNQLLKVDPLNVKSVLLSTTIIGRGDFCISDMRTYVEKLQVKGNFTSWSKKAVKIGLCCIPPVEQRASILALCNTTAISSLFIHIHEHFEKLYNKKAHVHHYKQVSKFHEDYFEECKENLLTHIRAYKQMENCRQKTFPRAL